MDNELQPGRELDALVAERVMGQVRVGACPLGDRNCPGKYEPQPDDWPNPCLPRYSTDIAAAWPIAEKHHFIVQGNKVYGNWKEWGDAWGVGEATPHAICLAALKAVGAIPSECTNGRKPATASQITLDTR